MTRLVGVKSCVSATVYSIIESKLYKGMCGSHCSDGNSVAEPSWELSLVRMPGLHRETQLVVFNLLWLE